MLCLAFFTCFLSGSIAETISSQVKMPVLLVCLCQFPLKRSFEPGRNIICHERAEMGKLSLKLTIFKLNKSALAMFCSGGYAKGFLSPGR